jgi:hypothetical protein
VRRKLLEDLKQQIENGSAIVIAGTGVSLGASNGDACASWAGLLHDGVDRCVSVAGIDAELADGLKKQIDSDDMTFLLSAAEVVSAKLGAPKGGEYGRWLRETVGSLKAQHRDVIEAMRGLGVPIATTNYDGLIEEVTGLPAVTWMDQADVTRIIRGEDEGVIHLHGFWKRPESIVRR